jgi:hypothetical protein
LPSRINNIFRGAHFSLSVFLAKMRQNHAERAGGASEKRRFWRRTFENRRFSRCRSGWVAENGWLKIVQKKVKKKLTPLAVSARFDLHTVNNNTLQHYK